MGIESGGNPIADRFERGNPVEGTAHPYPDKVTMRVARARDIPAGLLTPGDSARSLIPPPPDRRPPPEPRIFQLPKNVAEVDVFRAYKAVIKEPEFSDGTVPEYLGEGTTSKAWGLGRYVVRTALDKATKPRKYSIGSYVKDLTPGIGLPYLEQVVGASSRTGLVISQRIPGKSAAEAETADIEALTDEQYRAALDTGELMYRHNLIMDPAPGNFILNIQKAATHEQGIYMIDYWSTPHISLRDASYSLLRMLSRAGTPNVTQLEDPEDFARVGEVLRERLPLLRHFRGLCEVRYRRTHPDSLTMITDSLDDSIDKVEERIRNFDDSEYVSSTIQINRLQRGLREEKG